MQWLGIEPVFCDVRADDHTLDPDDVERRIGPRTGAILGVHLWGRACQVEALQAIADRHGIPLLLDAAHALGCGHAGRPLGLSGKAEVFSLHATKALNSLEGGLITTADAELANKLRLMRNFGFGGEDRVLSLGINAKMNEFCAAAGLSNLEGFEPLREHNRLIFEAYRSTLDGLPGLRLHAPDPGQLANHHYAVVELAPDLAPGRDALAELLRAENVFARRYFRPGCHLSEPYVAKAQSLPVSERLSRSLLQLPTGLQLDAAEAAEIGRLIAWCLRNGPAIAERRQAGVQPAR
jgi:dTDP-4-amino-4,6-dideoxygalactose transaminase